MLSICISAASCYISSALILSASVLILPVGPWAAAEVTDAEFSSRVVSTTVQTQEVVAKRVPALASTVHVPC